MAKSKKTIGRRRKIKSTTTASYLRTHIGTDEGSSVYTPATSTLKSARTIRDEGNKARQQRLEALQNQLTGVRVAASALAVEGGAEPDAGVPYIPGAYDGYQGGWVDVDDDEPAEISHGGGEHMDRARAGFTHIVLPRLNHVRQQAQLEHRRARLTQAAKHWKDQMPALCQAYLEWKAGNEQSEDDDMEGVTVFEVTAIYTFSRRKCFAIDQQNNELANVSLLRVGMLGCSPVDPSVAISLDSLELYHRLRRRHGQLGVQAMARVLCDLHDCTYRTHHREQLSIAFDVYLDILRHIKQQTDHALGRDTLNWRALNACPPCNYELEDEVPLVPRALHVVDGNYSSKRAANAGVADKREFPSDYLLSREHVNKFQYEVKGRPPPKEKEGDSPNIEVEVEDSEEEGDAPRVGVDAPGDAADGEVSMTPCAKNWKAAEAKNSALAIYDINGKLPMACRHGLIEVFCEIVRSGELAKYPLAVTDFLVDVYGPKQGLAFDIGCAYESTAKNSPFLGEKVVTSELQIFVNAFHGWAHNRLCQLKYHPLYRKGLGLEDLETLERFFSSSNSVARTIRHATTFHWHQAIDLHFRQWDELKYQELSRFMLNNYKQALHIIKEFTPEVLAFKERLQITDEDIEGWLAAERKFLEDLKTEPNEKVMACAYVDALIQRRKADEHWHAVSCMADVTHSIHPNDYAANARHTARTESERRSAMDQALIGVRAVADLESKLVIQVPWTESSPEYQETLTYMRQRDFSRILDKLEQLVVQRLFELSKANIVGMGYKLRETIWRALKTRGKAIRTALAKYNAIAPLMVPPAPMLEWKELMEFAFISEFELLKHSRSHQDITTELWASPLNREMTTKYYKILRAREELNRVNIEASRLRTSIRDEHNLFHHHIQRLTVSNPFLAHALQQMYNTRHRVNTTHNIRLDKLEALRGYSGRRGAGIRKNMNAASTPSLGQDAMQDDEERHVREMSTTGDESSDGEGDGDGDEDRDGDGDGEMDEDIAGEVGDLAAAFSADLRVDDGPNST